MDVDNVIAAPTPHNAEVTLNHLPLPGGGQQNHAAGGATTPVIVTQPHQANGQQLSIDQAASAARRIRFRHHLHQHGQIHPYVVRQLPPLIVLLVRRFRVIEAFLRVAEDEVKRSADIAAEQYLVGQKSCRAANGGPYRKQRLRE
jgi:hypothetical protein